MEIRNIAIIAHVDHGKTTLTDALMRQCGMVEEGVSMDSNQLEQERGITIYAKNTSVIYQGTKINIVDTPGHADFGSEVERVLRSIDSVLLLVDAQEGPMPQTRFVLKKSLELGLKPILVINKIDKPAADCARTHDAVFELMMELGANDEQLNFTTIYAIGRNGVAMLSEDAEQKDLTPLLDTVLNLVPVASGKENDPFQAQIFNLAYDNFLGRLAIARVYSGKVSTGSTITVTHEDGRTRNAKITKLFSFKGVQRIEEETVQAGDIVLVAGISDAYIGETLITDTATKPLPAILVDEPTISLQFLVNDSPFAGKEGKFVTSRQIRDRLERELEVNVGLRVDFDSTEHITAYGRGELHIAVLLETMRREGFELQVSQPQVITKQENGVLVEPWEELAIDVPSEFSGAVIDKLNRRKGLLYQMTEKDGITRLVYQIPTRGLMGYRGQFVIDTKGEGILSARVIGFKDHAGVLDKRDTGSMISMEKGKVLAYALWGLQERGTLYIEPNIEVYEGMVIGNTVKGEEMMVNPTKGKNLTNVRSSGNDEAIVLKQPILLNIERGLELMSGDEFLEITPKSIRLRKQLLTESERSRSRRK